LIIGPIKFELYTPDDFPKWIEYSAIWACEYHSRLWFYDSRTQSYDPDSKPKDPEQRRKAINTLRRPIRCLVSLAMKDTWLKISDLIYPGEADKSQAWFAKAIISSGVHPKSELMTKGDAAKWKKDAISKLAKAKDALNSMPDNYLDFFNNYRAVRLSCLQPSQMHDNDVSFSAMSWCLGTGVDHPIPVLEDALKALRETQFTPSFSGTHTIGESAERQFFVRSLTAAMIEKTGKKYRKIVAETTAAAFDCNITEREIIRLTKTLDDDTISNAKGYLLSMISDDFIADLCKDSEIAKASWERDLK